MSQPLILLGIDGGGSKTTALLSDLDGNVIGRGVAGPSNFQAIGHAAAQSALNKAVAIALGDAGLEPGAIGALCVGLAGADRPHERALFQAWARQTLPGAKTILVNDAALVLVAGTPAGWGLAVICGTGSIVYGRDPQGQLARADGWGHLLGDEGSGYAMGLSALRAVMQAFDGRGPATALTPAILDHWALTTPTDLVARVYREVGDKSEIAALAAIVEVAAVGGDEVAQRIVAAAAGSLAVAARAVVARLELAAAVPCALAGGVIVGGTAVRGAFERAATGLGLTLAPLTTVPEPAAGAIKLAQEAVRSPSAPTG